MTSLGQIDVTMVRMLSPTFYISHAGKKKKISFSLFDSCCAKHSNMYAKAHLLQQVGIQQGNML